MRFGSVEDNFTVRSENPLAAETLVNVPSCRFSYLVDPASSHMLVSKIKPCMCKYQH